MNSTRRGTALAGLVVAVLAGTTVAALAASQQTLTAKVTPSKAGTKASPKGAKLSLSLVTATDDGTQPPTASQVAILLPAQLVLNGRSFPSCTLATLDSTGPKGCTNAKIGSGSATGQVGSGASALIEQLGVTVFNGPKGKSLLLYLAGTSPVAFNASIGGAVSNAGTSGYGKKLTYTIPASAQQPIAGVRLSLNTLSTAIKATTTVKTKKKGKSVKTKVSYVGLTGCPKSKMLPFVVNTDYSPSGDVVVPSATATTTAPCT